MLETNAHRTFLPAAGRDWLLPLYDPLTKLLGADRARAAFLEQAAVQPGHRVLDIGCGTGSFAVQIKRLHPGVEVTALDPDPKALSRAVLKAVRADVEIQFDRGFSDMLPYPDAHFDRIFSSYMFHHLERDTKERTLQEVRRVLKPGGTLHLLDFAGAQSRHGSLLARSVDSGDRLADNTDDRIFGLMRAAGLADAKRLDDRRLFFWRIAYYCASAPASTSSAASRSVLEKPRAECVLAP